ncbi:MAG: FKBP-type peptidyl-prolyl cis-trans isomerase [Bacteroidales bacterium]|nr:FKBP-type peptidyl-prolyl cis-trans isomerase [Bacteroidales bacterium]
MKDTSYFKLLILTTLILIFVSCNKTGFKTDKSGLEYKFIVENKDSVKPEIGDILVLRMKYTTEKDSVIDENNYFRMQLKEPLNEMPSIQNGLAMMHTGDSAVFIVDAKTFYNINRKQKLPQFLKSDSKLTFYIKLIKVLSYEKFEQERRSLKISNRDKEEELLIQYLKNTNVTVEPTQSGLYYVETLKGKGKKPKPGKKVLINYMGYFVDGKIFDSTYKRRKPFEFSFGVGDVIQGLDEGISKMREGGKAKIIIPSYLAYGDKQQGPVAPYSTLIFEVELLRVE